MMNQWLDHREYPITEIWPVVRRRTELSPIMYTRPVTGIRKVVQQNYKEIRNLGQLAKE